MTREQFISHVEATQGSLRRFLVALCCGDGQLADDVAQESYIKAYLSMATMKDADKFKAWLYRIAYNTFISNRRSQRLDVGYDEAAEVASSDRTDGQFRYQELYAALEKLPGKERTAILLFYLEECSVNEIADTVEASQEAVRQYLSRGRKHLRGLLTEN